MKQLLPEAESQRLLLPLSGEGLDAFRYGVFLIVRDFGVKRPLPPCAAGEGGRWLDPERVWLQPNDPCRLVRQVKVVVG